MERTSFQPSNVMSLSRSSVQAKLLQLKPGQVFEGKVLKLYPNKTASLRLGTMNVVAHLQAAIRKGEKYFFQVTKNEGIPHLKVLETPRTSVPLPAQTPTEVLKAMDISPHRGNEMLLTLFQKEQIPFSKEMIQQGGALLKRFHLMNGDGISILTQMKDRNIPFTSTAFQAVKEALTGPSLAERLTKLQQTLLEAGTKTLPLRQREAVDSLRQMFTQVIETHHLSKKDVSNLSQAFARFEKNPTQLFHALKERRIVAKETTLQEWATNFRHRVLTHYRSDFMNMFSFSEAAVRQLEQLSPENFLRTFLQLLSAFEGREEAIFHRVLLWMEDGKSTVRPGLFQFGLEGKDIFSLLKNFPKTAGFLYEKNILASKTLTEAQQTNVKSVLLEQLPHLPKKVAEQAEALLHRLTGLQLLAEDQNGLLQQTTLQIPLFFAGHETDLTIQWEGKKTESGEIDPNHCRILFYLNMLHLGETIADVHIQERTVTVTIFNEHVEPTAILSLWQPLLKKQLEKLNYELNALYWKTPAKKKAAERYTPYVGWEGVDIRI